MIEPVVPPLPISRLEKPSTVVPPVKVLVPSRVTAPPAVIRNEPVPEMAAAKLPAEPWLNTSAPLLRTLPPEMVVVRP